MWDAATGKELFRRAFPEKSGAPGYSYATSLTYLPGGDRLATGLLDGTILIWDLEPRSWHTGVPAISLNGRALERLWNDLASQDAARAHQTVWTLAASPAEAVPFLKDRLRPASAIDVQQVRRWIAHLDSTAFAVRDDAGKKLAALDERAEPILRQALAAKPSLEVRKRLETLLADAEMAGHGLVRSAEVLRTLRAIRALEQIGNPQARQVLEILAAGDPAARPTRQAREAIERLAAKR